MTLGVITGFISGLLGIGGGVVLVPVLVLLFGLTPHKAIAVSLAVIVPTALAGAIKHFGLGNLDFRLALYITLGGVVGAYFGAIAAAYLSPEALKKVFGCFLVFMGLNMLFGWSSPAKHFELSSDVTEGK